jgi:hypothetical protein
MTAYTPHLLEQAGLLEFWGQNRQLTPSRLK